MRTLIKDTVNETGQSVTVRGWVNSVRSYGKLIFADLRDRSGLIQIVGDEKLKGIKEEDIVEVTGKINSRLEKYFNDKIITGKIELEVNNIKILAKSQELPFDIHQPELNISLPVLLDNRTLSFRHSKVKAIFKVQEVIINSFREALRAKDFMEFQSPTIIPAVPEGGAEVFKVDYFGHPAFLSQSPQHVSYTHLTLPTLYSV